MVFKIYYFICCIPRYIYIKEINLPDLVTVLFSFKILILFFLKGLTYIYIDTIFARCYNYIVYDVPIVFFHFFAFV
jgi:hypothetical protein